MARRAKAAPEVDEARRAKYEELYDEEVLRPMDFFPHDCNASDDPKLQRLRDEHGWEAMGRWWRIVEAMSAAQGHYLDVSREAQWARLAATLELEGADRAREFVGWLAECGLVDREALGNNHVMSARVIRNAEYVARRVASRRLGAWVTNR